MPQPSPISSKRRAVDQREDLADDVDEARRSECQDAEAQRNARPDRVPDRAQQGGAEGHDRAEQQDHPLGAETSIKTKPVRKVPRMLPTMPQA